MNILIVEDELLIAKVYVIHLRNSGHHVIATVTNSIDAKAKLEQEKADLILLDVQLKGGDDGIAFARELRKTNQCPIIFTTGNAYNKTMELIAGISNSRLMIKPVETSVLVRMINETV